MYKRQGVRTALGVSNISFGLPQRNMVNSTFLAAAFGCGPVSYTHLDVYKRQLFSYCLAFSLEFSFSWLVVHPEASCARGPVQWAMTSQPVSYTHLDVYKRQIEGEASHPPHEHQESSRGRMLEAQKKPNEVKRQ